MNTLAYELWRGDECFDLEIEYTLSPYDPGRIYGRPEDCYPHEGGEIEDLEVFLDGREFSLFPGEQGKIEKFVYENHVKDFDDDYFD